MTASVALATVAAAVLVSVTACGTPVPQFEPARAGVEPSPPAVDPPPSATVAAVVDGVTVDVRFPDGATGRVRVLAADAPERGECGHREAADALRALLPAGSPVYLGADAHRGDRDTAGRLLRSVETAGHREVAVEQVRAGWAVPDEQDPTKLTPALRVHQAAAQRARVGLWGMCETSGGSR